MDMFYHLKKRLECCGHPLKYSEEIDLCGHKNKTSYIAVCIACEKEYEINLEIK